MKNLFKKLVFSGIAFALFGGYFAFPAFADTIRSLPQYIITKNEGSQITARTTSLDFVGSGVNATVSGNDVTVTVSSAGSLSNFSFTNANGFEGTVTDASSTPNLTLTTGLSLNSIPFIDASGGLLDDTANLVWDNSNDRLGLGTPSPSVRLDVRRSGTGEIAYFLDSSLNGVIYGTDTNLGYLTSSSGLTGLGFGINGGTYALRINPSGYIGIGTATPASTVDIVSNQTVPLYIRSTRTISYNQIQTSDTGYNTTYDGFTFGINGIDAYFYNRENAKIYFGTNDNARMIINANGYISMGTNANFRQLAVYDAANGQGALYGYSSQTGASYYSGNLILGSSSSYMGSIDYGYGADSIFAFSNTQNNNSARIDFKLKNAGTPVTPLSIKGSGQVGFSTTSPDGSALVDMVSTTSGFLPPRMTGTEAEAIESPADGLLIFCNNGNGATITSTGWWGYDGGWVKLN